MNGEMDCTTDNGAAANHSNADGNDETTLISLFDVALASGDRNRIAVRLNFPSPLVTTTMAMEERRLTYGEMDENADVIAQRLRDVGACHAIVACALEAHVNVPSVMLGVMRVPAVFFFVDLSTAKRWKIFRDLKIKYLIAEDRRLDDFIDADLSSSVAMIHHLHGTVEGLLLYDFKDVDPVQRYDYVYSNGWQLAYVVSTSGSTGTPKLVRVPHRCIVPNVVHFKQVYRVTSADVILVASPMTFDPSVVDIFLALSSGACIVLVPDIVKHNPRALVSVMTNINRVTIIQATPSLMKRFGADLLSKVVLGPTSALRVLGLGGEPCPDLATLSLWINRDRKVSTELYNVYGITEVSAWASLQRIHLGKTMEFPDMDVPLGEAIPGTDMMVLDNDGRRIRVGEGQLFLGGSTRKCFVDFEDFRDVMYKPVLRPSGDYVRIDAQGRIFHLNRIDDRIKRNGKFVSLRQLEKASLMFPNVIEARAVWNSTREKVILAVLLNKRYEVDGQITAENDFLRKLKNHVNVVCDVLLDGVVLLDSMPITAHGKFDEQKIAALDANRLRRHRYGRSEGEVCAALKSAWNVSSDLRGIRNMIHSFHTDKCPDEVKDD